MELLDQDNNKTIASSQHQSKSIDLKRELLKYVKLWPWILISMALFYTLSTIYLRYTQPQFLSKTSLMLQKSKSNNNAALSDLKNLGMGVSGDDELEGETTVITSKPLLQRVVENLDLNISVASIGKIKEVELYKDSPIQGSIIELKNESSFSGATIHIETLGNNKFKIIEGVNENAVFSFNRPISLVFGVIQLNTKNDFSKGSQFKIQIKSTSSIIKSLEGAISVSLPQGKGLLMDLSLVGTVPQKSEDILNELTKQYNIEGVNDKNLEAQNTQDFINERLEIITADLDGVEGQKEGFKRQNNITDIDAQANLALSNANESTKQLMNLTTQLELVNSIAKLTNSDRLLPTNMGLSGTTEESIAQYNELLLTRNKTQKQATALNPALVDLNKQISEIRTLVKSNLEETKHSLNIQIGRLQGQLSSDQSIINRYPTQEKVFRSIERQRTLKEQLYLYLLQKREENAITLAVTAPKSKVINPAYTTGQISPKTSQIKMGSLALGFVLPIAILFLLNFFDTKIKNKQQIINRISGVPVLAEIPKTVKEHTVIKENDFSMFAESFRILTSNLKYLLKAKSKTKGGVILVTSSIKGEGKTTIATNIAQTLAGSGKTLIMGADIRNPQLQRIFQEVKVGLTDYLIAETDDPTTYIKNTGAHANLDVLMSGRIAPNPTDLLDMEKMNVLMSQLRALYDYIVIDSAPVVLVSDTLHLIEHADTVLYVVKSNYTDKTMLNFSDEFRNNNRVQNMAYVLNAVDIENTAYNYKYGYGYSGEEKKSTWWNILNR